VKSLRQPPPRPAKAVTSSLLVEAEKYVKRLSRQKATPREIPKELWPQALSVIERAELSAIETALLPLRHRAKKTAPGVRDIVIRPSAGWSIRRKRRPLRNLGIVLDRLPSPQVPTLLSTAVAAEHMAVEHAIATAPDEPQGGVSALVLAAADMTGLSRFAALRPEDAVVGLSLGLWGLPRCDVIVVSWSPRIEALTRVLSGLSPTRILLAGFRDLLVVAEGEADPRQIALELAAQAERCPQGRQGVVSPSRSLNRALRKAIKEISESAATGAFVVQVDDMAGAMDLADRMGPDIIWLLAAQPETWIQDLRWNAPVLVGTNSPPALTELAAPPAWVSGAGPSNALSPAHFVQERFIEELTTERHHKIALAAARIAESEFRPISARAAAWVRHNRS